MAYVKNNWVDREGTTRYFETVDSDGAKIFTPDYTQVTELGTPVNADNMNHIEDGIEAGSFTKFNLATTYAKNDLVTAIVVNDLKVYKSLQDNNIGNELTNATFWEEVKLAGGSGGSGFNLFDTKISDHILEGKEAIGWALQGTYVNGAVYPDFYNKCLEEFNEATATETVNGVTVKVNANGHKFYNIADKASIDNFFNTMGTAWFYGVDTEQERVFLPRNNYFEQLTVDTTKVCQSIEAGLPNITGTADGFGRDGGVITTGAFTSNASTSGACSSTGYNYHGLTFNASRSNPIYGKSNTVQPPAVKKLLYICVGNTIVNEEQIDASKVLSEAVLRSSLVECHVVIETYVNGTSWYRIWSDGWCEQGGQIYNRGENEIVPVSLLKPFKYANYQVLATNNTVGKQWASTVDLQIADKTTNGFGVVANILASLATNNVNWEAKGYIW